MACDAVTLHTPVVSTYMRRPACCGAGAGAAAADVPLAGPRVCNDVCNQNQ